MRAGVRVSCVRICVGILGRGTSWCKGLKVGVCLVGIAQSPQSLVRAKDGSRVGDETRGASSLQSHPHWLQWNWLLSQVGEETTAELSGSGVTQLDWIQRVSVPAV